ncbi:MAG: methylated-DNA--[protein]-cysteine S-methyltransferase [Desulfosarcinaceae bacterium]|nr:methylated-DNA--[protein]-cysteine S-methyltransferase [Desulfosarcinaceae bacterium]
MNAIDFNSRAADYVRIAKAIAYLQDNFQDQPDLDTLAAQVHLSKYHFQRLFKRWAGVTPNQFLQFLTLEYAKARLDESKSLLETALDAGLSGSSRLHDLFVTFEGITPGEYKRQCAGLPISHGFYATPFGRCLLATTPRGICHLGFIDTEPAVTALEELRALWPGAVWRPAGATGAAIVARIFRAGPTPPGRPFHLLLKGTNFQIKVWRALLKLPAGAMLSYGDLADVLGIPTAVRAVAGAVARNPVAYLIPCHRVITKSGRIHHYRWGATRKRAILAKEAAVHQTAA